MEKDLIPQVRTLLVVSDESPGSIVEIFDFVKDISDEQIYLDCLDRFMAKLEDDYSADAYRVDLYFAPAVYNIPSLRHRTKQVLPKEIFASNYK